MKTTTIKRSPLGVLVAQILLISWLITIALICAYGLGLEDGKKEIQDAHEARAHHLMDIYDYKGIPIPIREYEFILFGESQQ